MAHNFQRGDTIVFNLTPDGLANVTLGIKSHNIDIEALLHDVTNNTHGGGTARIAGKEDGRGTVSAALDIDSFPHSATFNIRPGRFGLMFFGLTTAKSIQFPFIVAKLHYETTLESAVIWSFDVQMNVIAGSLVYPA